MLCVERLTAVWYSIYDAASVLMKVSWPALIQGLHTVRAAPCNETLENTRDCDFYSVWTENVITFLLKETGSWYNFTGIN